MWGQRLEPGGSRAVTDDRARMDGGGGCSDLAVGDTQKNRIAARAVGTAAKRADQLEPRPSAQCAGDGCSKAADADYRESRPATGVVDKCHLSWSIPCCKVTAYVNGTHCPAWLASPS